MLLNFLNLNPEAFALDISDFSLKVARIKKKGKFFSLASWGEIGLPPGVVIDGEIEEEDLLVKSIKELLEKIKGKRLGTKNVAISLPEKKAFIQVIRMPKLKEEELKKAVPFEAENYIPFPVSEVYFDFQVVPQIGGGAKDYIDVLVAAVPKKIADKYVSCLKKAGLRPMVFEIESQSIGRSLIKNEISPHPVLIIDFGRSRTSFLIYSGNSLYFTSSIPISSEKITEAIARSLKVNFKEAEQMKIKYGIPAPYKKPAGDKTKKDDISAKIFEITIPIITDLAEQAKRYMEYFETHSGSGEALPGKRIEKIILSGKAANIKNFASYISAGLKVPAELGNPWVNILPSPIKEIPAMTFGDSLGYTTALGLAIRAARGEDLS